MVLLLPAVAGPLALLVLVRVVLLIPVVAVTVVLLVALELGASALLRLHIVLPDAVPPGAAVLPTAMPPATLLVPLPVA